MGRVGILQTEFCPSPSLRSWTSSHFTWRFPGCLTEKQEKQKKARWTRDPRTSSRHHYDSHDLLPHISRYLEYFPHFSHIFPTFFPHFSHIFPTFFPLAMCRTRSRLSMETAVEKAKEMRRRGKDIRHRRGVKCCEHRRFPWDFHRFLMDFFHGRFQGTSIRGNFGAVNCWSSKSSQRCHRGKSYIWSCEACGSAGL